MSLRQIALHDYDTVVAVTQNAVNEALAEFLDQLQKKVALYYTNDSEGNYIPVSSAAEAFYIFTGTLDYARDQNGNPVDVVQLYNPGQGNQTVRYNVTFNEAEYIQKPAIHVSQKPGAPPWIFKFHVNLSLQAARLDQLPHDIQAQVKQGVGNLGPNMFSIQQLYLDLNTAALDTFENVEGVNPVVRANLGAILEAYLKEQQSQGGIILGYNVTYTGTQSPAPTFMPTALSFCVTPYHDASGNTSNPGLDTLNYLLMTGHRVPPPYPPQNFTFNWVDDGEHQGAMAINSARIVPFVAHALSPILKTLCPTVYAKPTEHRSVYDQVLRLDPGDDHEFQFATAPRLGEPIAQYSYSDPVKVTHHFFLSHIYISADYSMTCKVFIVPATSSSPGDRIRLVGAITTEAKVHEEEGLGFLNRTTVEMPQTTYSWSVDLVLQMDLAQGGQLDFAIENADFGSPPVVAKHHESWWKKWLDGLSGQFKAYVQGIGDLRGQVQTGIEGQIKDQLASTLQNMNHFVFPGARTFVFQNPQFSDAFDLAANVTYLTPGAQAQAAVTLPEEHQVAYVVPGRTRTAGTAAKLHYSTELMKNQKAALILPPRSEFAALQTSTGEALFFSIGDDDVFHLTVERPGQPSGWVPLDLSSGLAQAEAEMVKAKTFAVFQDAASGEVTLAVAVNGTAGDRVYVLTGLSGAPDAAWLEPVAQRPWAMRPFDAAGPTNAPLDVAYLHLAQGDTPGRAPALIVGLRDDQTGYIQNYSVDVDSAVTADVWHRFQTAENYDQLLAQHVGKPGGAMYAGLYQLYELGGEVSLVFVPMRGLFGPPTITKLHPPAQAQALAVIPTGNSADTDLYVGAEDGVYFYASGAQGNGAQGVKIIDNPVITGVRHLELRSSPGQLFLWGLSRTGQVFYSRCPKGHEADANAWSYPIPIEQDVQQIASLLNRSLEANEVFAHTSGQQLVRLTQDPLTTLWRERSILLPPLETTDMVEHTTYTTHIALTDDNGLPLTDSTVWVRSTSPGNVPLTGLAVWISSTSPCNVYVNNLYTSLLPGAPLEVRTDETGTVTIVQEVQTLGAVAYNLHGADGVVHNINPTKTVTDRMAAVKTGADLGRITITDEQGQSRPLVPPSVTAAERDVAAASLQQLAVAQAAMPADGSVVSPPAWARARVGRFDPTREHIWGRCLEGDGTGYYEGARALEACGLTLLSSGVALYRTSDGAVGSMGDAIRAEAGDIYRWLRQAYAQVRNFVVQTAHGVSSFFIQIGEHWYHAFLTCINDVVHAAEFVFQLVKAAFDDLVQWLGFIFGWQDILRTHAVLRNLIQQYAAYAIGRIPTYRQKVVGMFDGLQQKIDAWAGLENTGGSFAGFAGAPALPGRGSPQANWGSHQFKGNIAAATTAFDASVDVTDTLRSLLDELTGALAREGAVFERAYSIVENQIVDQLEQLSAGEIIRRILAVLADVLVASAENVVVAALDVIQILAESMLGALTATLHVPVLSPLYRSLTGSDLSFLDLCCLIVAVPATIVYKALRGRVPFPDDAFTSAVVRATSFEELQTLYAGQAEFERARPSDDESRNAVIYNVAAAAAGFGAFIFPFITAAKERTPDSKACSIVNSLWYFVATLPNVVAVVVAGARQDWAVILGEVIYGFTFVQKIADIAAAVVHVLEAYVRPINKGLDVLFGILSFVPIIGAIAARQDALTVIVFLAVSFWSFSSILSPFARSNRVKAIAGSCIWLYGGLNFVSIAFITPSQAPLPTPPAPA